MGVDDAGGRRIQRRDAFKRGLQCSGLAAIKQAQIIHTVFKPTLEQAFQLSDLRFRIGNDQLSGSARIDPMTETVRVEGMSALDAESGFQAPGRVIDARVDNLRVARARADTDCLASFYHQHFMAGPGHFACHGKPYYASAYDYAINIDTHVTTPSQMPPRHMYLISR
ncbi:hypothetical protein PFUM301598_16530 [Pseudomonas fluorescens]